MPFEYYPRIFRPGGFTLGLHFANIIENSAVAIAVLVDRLDHLFRVIEPDTRNLDAFGHEIRNLLLLACMEVEAGWSAVLRANGYSASRLTTNDYVRLLGPLHLAEYEVRLTSYPTMQALNRFLSWDGRNPTQSLPWYHAYNQTKHDREMNFAVGTLRHAIDAVAAAVVLFYAQFGRTDDTEDPMSRRQRFDQWSISKWPTFPAEEWYIFPLHERPLHIDGPLPWTPVSYPL